MPSVAYNMIFKLGKHCRFIAQISFSDSTRRDGSLDSRTEKCERGKLTYVPDCVRGLVRNYLALLLYDHLLRFYEINANKVSCYSCKAVS